MHTKNATTHREDIPALKRNYPQTTVKENIRWVEDGKIITFAKISTGIHMSLYIVKKCSGEHAAEKAAKQIDFNWQKI